MLNLLGELERWASQQRALSDGLVSIAYRRGRADVPKQSADICLESAFALGVVAVWESGEIEAEVLEIATMTRLFVFSGVIRDAGEVREVLGQALSAIQERG